MNIPLTSEQLAYTIFNEPYTSKIYVGKNSCTITAQDPNSIIDIKEIVENKVTEVMFGDGHTEKMVLQDPDIFCMEDCLYIALAKRLYKKTFTFDGIEKAANDMKYIKYYNRLVHDGLKLWKNIKKYKEEKLLEEQRIIKRREKRAAYKAKREERRKEDAIYIQKEAYLRALKELNEDKLCDNCSDDCCDARYINGFKNGVLTEQMKNEDVNNEVRS